MATRRELADSIRELIRQISSADPTSRKLALIEQLLNSLISDFAALSAAVADYAQERGQEAERLKAEVEDLKAQLIPNAMFKHRAGLVPPASESASKEQGAH